MTASRDLIKDGWFTEDVPMGFRQCLRVEKIIHDAHSAAQHSLVFDSDAMGRVLVLDGVVQLTTADEFIYHEMMAHVPVLAHPAPQNVLIIGGGDGGILREVLRHPAITATLVEIDDTVVDLSRRYFPAVHDGAFDNPRARVIIGDGAAFIRDTDETFDVIIVDSSDPGEGPSGILFTPEFYSHCHARLRPEGVIVAMMGVPFTDAAALRKPLAAWRGAFTDHGFYHATVPSYHGGPLLMGYARKDAAAATPPRALPDGMRMRYYNTALHQAAFILPEYMRAVIAP